MSSPFNRFAIFMFRKPSQDVIRRKRAEQCDSQQTFSLDTADATRREKNINLLEAIQRRAHELCSPVAKNLQLLIQFG